MGVPEDLAGVAAHVVGEAGLPVGGRAFRNLVLEAHGAGASLLVIPAGRLVPAFFDLRTGVAGDILQASVVYSTPLAVLGPVPEPAASSCAFAALVRESNAGSQHWFVPTREALEERIRRG